MRGVLDHYMRIEFPVRGQRSRLVELCPELVWRGVFFLSPRNRRSDIDWVKNSVNLTRMPKWRALHDHFVCGASWEETGIVDEVLYLRQMKEVKLRLPRGRNEVIDRYRELDSVYEDISQNGYRTDRRDCPRVARSRDGTYLFTGNGWHRLWMARHFEIPSITFNLWMCQE